MNIKEKVFNHIKAKSITPRAIEYVFNCPSETRLAIAELINEGVIYVNDNFELEVKTNENTISEIVIKEKWKIYDFPSYITLQHYGVDSILIDKAMLPDLIAALEKVVVKEFSGLGK